MTDLTRTRKRHYYDFAASQAIAGTRTFNNSRQVDRPRESVKRVEFVIEKQVL